MAQPVNFDFFLLIVHAENKDKDKDKDAFIGPKEFVLHIDNGKQQSDKLRH